jgi:hypothetical protein
MSNRMNALVALVWLVAGTAMAEEQDMPGEPASTYQEKLGIAEASAPATGDTVEAKDRSGATKQAAQQALHPSARPAYLNGGYFGDPEADKN